MEAPELRRPIDSCRTGRSACPTAATPPVDGEVQLVVLALGR